MLSTVLFSELSKDIACNWVTVEHAQLMPRRRPNRFLQSARQLRDLRNVRMMHKRGAGALVRRSLNIRLDYLQPMSRVHDGCCGAIWILYSAGQPCRNLSMFGATLGRFLGLAGSYARLACLSNPKFV